MDERVKNSPIEKININLKETSWYQETIRSPEFKKWFSGSKVVSDDGSPMPLFHITPADFDEFDIRHTDLGIHFGELETVHERSLEIVRHHKVYDGWRIIPVFLNIQNPLETKDLLFFSAPQAMQYLRKQSSKTQGDLFFERLRKVFHLKHSYSLKSMAAVRSLLQKRGFDGLKYKNEYEGTITNSYMVLDETQIWYPISREPAKRNRKGRPQLEPQESMCFESIEILNNLTKE